MKHNTNLTEKIYDAADTFMEISQVVLGILILACILIEAIAWLFMGRIHTFGGIVLAIVFILLGCGIAVCLVEDYKSKRSE